MAEGPVVCTETDLAAHAGLLTPPGQHFHRNNFPYPQDRTGLTIEGRAVRFEEQVSREMLVTLECAGNGRAYLSPPVPGEQWNLGAVSTARWAGVPLADVLAESPAPPGTVEVLFEGADGFARSLPLEMARHPDVLLATAMNGEPLPMDHGGPVRLLVPGWYGMASVKWLTAIRYLGEPFRGHFQVERYVIDGRPVREIQVRALITRVADGRVWGYAWSGAGAIASVELSGDGGATWVPAELIETAGRYAWTRWEASWKGQGELLARATDAAGSRQPLEQVWNALGYCNNAAVPFKVSAG